MQKDWRYQPVVSRTGFGPFVVTGHTKRGRFVIVGQLIRVLRNVALLMVIQMELLVSYTIFYKNQMIFVEARWSYSKIAKISNFSTTLLLFYTFKTLFRMSTFISINSMIVASSWVTSPDGNKSEPNCSYKVCSYKRKKSVTYCSDEPNGCGKIITYVFIT